MAALQHCSKEKVREMKSTMIHWVILERAQIERSSSHPGTRHKIVMNQRTYWSAKSDIQSGRLWNLENQLNIFTGNSEPVDCNWYLFEVISIVARGDNRFCRRFVDMGHKSMSLAFQIVLLYYIRLNCPSQAIPRPSNNNISSISQSMIAMLARKPALSYEINMLIGVWPTGHGFKWHATNIHDENLYLSHASKAQLWSRPQTLYLLRQPWVIWNWGWRIFRFGQLTNLSNVSQLVSETSETARGIGNREMALPFRRPAVCEIHHELGRTTYAHERQMNFYTGKYCCRPHNWQDKAVSLDWFQERNFQSAQDRHINLNHSSIESLSRYPWSVISSPVIRQNSQIWK
jgi:hypothetical protein